MWSLSESVTIKSLPTTVFWFYFSFITLFSQTIRSFTSIIFKLRWPSRPPIGGTLVLLHFWSSSFVSVSSYGIRRGSVTLRSENLVRSFGFLVVWRCVRTTTFFFRARLRSLWFSGYFLCSWLSSPKCDIVGNQSNHITRFGSGILYPNYLNIPKNNQKYSLDMVLFEYFYPNYHILSENTQKVLKITNIFNL